MIIVFQISYQDIVLFNGQSLQNLGISSYHSDNQDIVKIYNDLFEKSTLSVDRLIKDKIMSSGNFSLWPEEFYIMLRNIFDEYNVQPIN